MRKLFLLACILLLAGCTAKRPAATNLNLQIVGQPAGIYNETSAVIRGHDAREFEEVIEFQLGKDPVLRIPNLSPTHILVTERLAGGFKQQGLTFSNDSEARILLDINNLLVTVTKPQMLYVAEAKSNLSLKVVSGNKTITKKYDRQVSKESMTKPKIESLEGMLNDQLSDIIMQILQDDEIRSAIIAQ